MVFLIVDGPSLCGAHPPLFLLTISSLHSLLCLSALFELLTARFSLICSLPSQTRHNPRLTLLSFVKLSQSSAPPVSFFARRRERYPLPTHRIATQHAVEMDDSIARIRLLQYIQFSKEKRKGER